MQRQHDLLRLSLDGYEAHARLARCCSDRLVARIKFSVMLERTVRELKGMPCITFEMD